MMPDLKLCTLLLISLALTQCALFGPAGPANNAGVVSEEMSDLLKPNSSGLNFPVYTKYAEVEPFFRQKNDNITYIVNFWATWCRPCIREKEHFEQLTRESSRDDLQVIMISVDKEEDVPTKMKDFVAERPLALPVVAFTDNFYDGWIYKVAPAWQRSSIPVTLFYRNGKRYFNKGQISSYRELTSLVDRVR